MITPERAQLSAALAQVVDGLVELVVAGVVEQLRPQRELVAIRTAPAPSEPATRPGAPSDLLTISEVATLLNIPKGTVQFWTYRTKTLPHVSVGPGGRSGRKACRIRRADVDAFIESQPSEPRGSARAQAVELLAVSEQRSEVRRRRRLERADAPPKRQSEVARKAEAPSTEALERQEPGLNRKCPSCSESKPLREFKLQNGGADGRCQECLRRVPVGPTAPVVDLREATRRLRSRQDCPTKT